ncbi:uncharacterized protein LOC126161271 [Schistocerca cancellata]|uniref:uncharacterized protein LOC126161271 n=1 Tax=Schistocerca cancellata TaxID=274614 RepID=UPI0021172F3B|nr:uncharacterized protein LOC126161271 [Schistocerca cancellata]
MLIVKSPPDQKGAAPAAEGDAGGGRWRRLVCARARACCRGLDTRTALVVLGALHVSLGMLMAAAGALGAARGAAVAAAGAALWGGGAAGAAGAAALWAGLRGRGARGAAAFLALSLCALALSNLVAVLAAVGLARDAARARDLPDAKVSGSADASPMNAGLLAVSALHVAVCVWSACRTCRLACPCARGSAASSRSDGSRGSSWCSSVASGRRRLVSSWLGQQHRPAAAAAAAAGAPHVVLVAPPLPPPGQPILAPLYAIQTPATKLQPASVINFHIPASLPYMNPMPKHRHGRPRPQSLPYSQSLARPKRKRIVEDQRRHHTLDGRHSNSVPAKTQPKKKRQITEEEVEKTYTGLDRNLAEEFISIAMEPGVGKERLARSASDGVSSSSQPPASI